MEVKDRKDIDVKDTWNLESIYANNELWEEDYAALEKDAAEFAKLKGAIEADVSKIPAVFRCLLWTASPFKQIECLRKNAL